MFGFVNRGCCLVMLMKHVVMNSQLPLLYCAKNCMRLASLPVFRRQRFFIRSLGGSIDYHTNCSSGKMQSVEVDAQRVIREITPVLDRSRHKGQAGTQFLQIHIFNFFH